MISSRHFQFTALVVSLLLGGITSCADHSPPVAATTEQPRPSRLILSDSGTLVPVGGRNPTVAVDQFSGTVFLAWAQDLTESDAPKAAENGKKPDPKRQALLVRSVDGGQHFSAPVVVSPPEDDVRSHTVSPTQVAVGPKGEVYVLYNRKEPDFTLPNGVFRGRNQLRLARSEDGGKTFAAPIDIATEAVEGAIGSPGMINLFIAANGDLYASWLDYREMFTYLTTHKKEPPKNHSINTQLRVARSTDGGRSFSASTLVTKPVCGCCGTKVAQKQDGPLFASTRAAWPELQGSVDAVRDIIVATSEDHGASWTKPIKVHDDRFKISACPDVAPGLSVDSKGLLHAAWYTGTERNPGIYYAVSSDNGKSFAKPIALLTDEWVPYADVKLSLDSHDNAWVAFEDRRGDTDLIHLVRVDRNGTVTRAEPWPGTIPDVAARDDSAVVAWDGLAPEDEDQSGSVHVLIARPETGS